MKTYQFANSDVVRTRYYTMHLAKVEPSRKEQAMSKTSKGLESLKTSEVWHQDAEDPNLWHGQHGVIVNTSALLEREFFYTIERVLCHSPKAQAALYAAVVYA